MLTIVPACLARVNGFKVGEYCQCGQTSSHSVENVFSFSVYGCSAFSLEILQFEFEANVAATHL